jgi:hypothetical protein
MTAEGKGYAQIIFVFTKESIVSAAFQQKIIQDLGRHKAQMTAGSESTTAQTGLNSAQ